MRLSEAILLGVTFSDEPITNETWGTCFCGVALRAFGEPQKTNGTYNWMNEDAEARWPWLKNVHTYKLGARITGASIVTDLAHEYEHGRMTLEQAVDAIRAIEPDEDSFPPATADTPANGAGLFADGTVGSGSVSNHKEVV